MSCPHAASSRERNLGFAEWLPMLSSGDLPVWERAPFCRTKSNTLSPSEWDTGAQHRSAGPPAHKRLWRCREKATHVNDGQIKEPEAQQGPALSVPPLRNSQQYPTPPPQLPIPFFWSAQPEKGVRSWGFDRQEFGTEPLVQAAPR